MFLPPQKTSYSQKTKMKRKENKQKTQAIMEDVIFYTPAEAKH